MYTSKHEYLRHLFWPISLFLTYQSPSGSLNDLENDWNKYRWGIYARFLGKWLTLRNSFFHNLYL